MQTWKLQSGGYAKRSRKILCWMISTRPQGVCNPNKNGVMLRNVIWANQKIASICVSLRRPRVLFWRNVLSCIKFVGTSDVIASHLSIRWLLNCTAGNILRKWGQLNLPDTVGVEESVRLNVETRLLVKSMDLRCYSLLVHDYRDSGGLTWH